ncbi:MAG: DUF4258 domain-containing protein [bacterium]
MDAEEIKDKVSNNQYSYSYHADIERRIDELTIGQIEEAILNGKITEQYSDDGRGECCLVVGFAGDIPVHIVCGWRGEKIVLITVYIPRPPKFIDPWTRGDKINEREKM